MGLKHKKWITFTPMAFRGDEETFFSRDSGLCCRTLQALGAKVTAVMPEPAWDDTPDILRVPYGQLSDPAFWRSQNVEAVISYSWGYPRYAPIAEAIKKSGTKLFLNMDTTGIISPLITPAAYIQKMMWYEQQQNKGLIRRSAGALARSGWHCTTLNRDLLRLRHMGCADAIGVVSPVAADRIRRYARFFGRNDIARKVQYVPHPVDQSMECTGVVKEEMVIAVGRWDDFFQKRPEILIDVAVKVLSQNPNVRFVIVGKEAVRYSTQIASRLPSARDRLSAYERLEHDRLREKMNLSQISLCTSRYESFHIVSGEALLCGCSVVAPRSSHMPAFSYFSGDGRSGRVVENNVLHLADAVLAELDAWRNGERDAELIAQLWRDRVRADAVVSRIDSLLSL